MAKSLRKTFEDWYSSKRRHPDPIGTLEDAQAYAVAAHRKAAEYLAKGEALQAEVSRLERALDAASAKTRRQKVDDEIVTALRQLFENPWLAAFVADAVVPSCRIDALAKRYNLPRPVAEELRSLWRRIDNRIGLVNAEAARRAARIQQGDGIPAGARAH